MSRNAGEWARSLLFEVKRYGYSVFLPPNGISTEPPTQNFRSVLLPSTTVSEWKPYSAISAGKTLHGSRT